MKTFISPQIIIVLSNLLINLVEGILGLRIILKMFGASTSAPFVRWIYETSQPLLTPFIGMFPSPTLTGGFILEFSALFAVMFYLFIGYVVTEVIAILVQNASQRSVGNYNNE